MTRFNCQRYVWRIGLKCIERFGVRTVGDTMGKEAERSIGI